MSGLVNLLVDLHWRVFAWQEERLLLEDVREGGLLQTKLDAW